MDKKILLQNLADALAERTGITKRKAEGFVRSFFEVTENALVDDGQVKVKNFGTTKIINVSDRESININTGERFQIEGHAKISFTPDTFFRDLVNRPFAHFTTIILDDDIEDADLMDEAPIANNEEELPVAEKAPSVVEAPLAEEKVVAEEAPAAEEAAGKEDPIAEEELVIVNEEEIKEAVEIEESEAIGTEEETEADEEIEEDDETTSESITAAAHIDGNHTPIIINNTLPEPQHNWWRTAFTLLVIAVVALISYFAGYYRILCPCNFINSAPDIVATNDSASAYSSQADSKALADATAKAKTDSVAKVKNDSIAKAKSDSIAKVQAQAIAKAKADSISKAAQKAAKAAEAEKVSQRERDLANAQKYNQLPGSAYLIAGTMQTLRVRRGENLFMIAKRYYGNKDFARYIVHYNNIADPNLVTVGQNIRLPRLILR